MHIEQYRDFCLALPDVTEGFPFDEKILVFKVGNKIFALTDVEDFESINLKCDPVRAIQLREEYDEIVGGYHMNKKHWNTVSTNGAVPDSLLEELILHSYDLVLASLPKAVQKNIMARK